MPCNLVDRWVVIQRAGFRVPGSATRRALYAIRSLEAFIVLDDSEYVRRVNGHYAPELADL